MENPPIFKFGKPSISMGHLYSIIIMAMLNNQRVTHIFSIIFRSKSQDFHLAAMADIGRASSATSTSFVARPRRTASAALSSSSGDAWPSPSPSSCPKRDARRETDRASWAVFACFRHWIRKSAGPEMSETSLIGKKNGASLRSPEQKQASSSHKAGGTLTRSTQSCRLRASKKHSRWSQRGEKHNDQLIDLKRNFQLGYSYDPQQQPQACNWQGKAWQFFPRLFVAQKKWPNQGLS